MKLISGLISKETVVLCRLGSEIQNLAFSRLSFKGKFLVGVTLKCWIIRIEATKSDTPEIVDKILPLQKNSAVVLHTQIRGSNF